VVQGSVGWHGVFEVHVDAEGALPFTATFSVVTPERGAAATGRRTTGPTRSRRVLSTDLDSDA
jgi:hypothetical protein